MNISSVIRSGSGIVLAYLCLAAIIYLLQLFPRTGVFLMMLGAPAWIGVMTHILMGALAWFSLRGEIARAWVLLPVLYYGGGYALHLVSWRMAQREAAEIEARNATQAASVETPFSFVPGGFETLELLERFRVDYGLSGLHSRRTGKVIDRERTKYIYAAGAACERRPSSRSKVVPVMPRRMSTGEAGAGEWTQCVLNIAVHENEAGLVEPIYEIDSRQVNRPSDFWMDRALTRWSAVDLRTQTTIAQVEVGTLMPLPPIQFLIAGCALDSGAAAWRCFFRLMPGPPMINVGQKPRKGSGKPLEPDPDPETSPVYAIGHALGLELRTPYE